MNIFLNILFLFFLGGFVGYFIELIYRRIVHHHFINPGFLHGPFLPIYGFGLLLLYGLSSVPLNFIQIKWVDIILRIVLIFISLTLIEYIGGLIFIKGLNIRLWDYSNRKGNIQGIICPLFFFVWGGIGTFYFFFIHPLIVSLLKVVDSNIFLSFFMGLFLGILLLDFINSFQVAKKVGNMLRKLNLHISYDTLKSKLKTYASKHHLKHNFFRPFHHNFEKIKDINSN